MQPCPPTFRRAAVWMAVIVALGMTPAASAQDFGTDTLAVIKAEESPSASELTVRLSESTPLPSTDTVVIGRDDQFADSLASGVLQAESPLLLVPRDGPIPARVRGEIERLEASRAILLGGEAALTATVADELTAMGLEVERRAGASRFQTATEIARTDAGFSGTAILARAFPSPGATDASQGFADALAAGGMAASNGWPVLLTETDVLTGVTRDYLVEAGISEVKLMGGTAAISAAVEAELQAMDIATDRLAGASRAETAIEVAKDRGAETAADVTQVILVQGQTEDAWAGGFAAAARSALFDAPIVLAVGDRLPPETEAWLAAAADPGFTQQEEVRITCVVVPALCEEARVTLGLPPTPPPEPADRVAGWAFDGSLAADTSGAPALEEVVGEEGTAGSFVTDPEEGQVFAYPDGSGLRLSWATGTLPQDRYTIAMRVLIDDVAGYVRLLDFSNRQSDEGLYLLGGAMEFYGLAGSDGTAVEAGTWHTIVLTRSSRGLVNGYIDGVRVLTVDDEAQQALLLNDSVLLFQDDLQFQGETSSGRISRLEVFDGPLTSTAVAEMG